jgi:hypothetical protein
MVYAEEQLVFQIPAACRLPFAAVLLGIAVIFSVAACLYATPTLGMCAGVCLVSSGRVGYAVAREQGFLFP